MWAIPSETSTSVTFPEEVVNDNFNFYAVNTLNNDRLRICVIKYTLFYISNAFRSNVKLKLAKNQANAKQHLESELLIFENYSHYLSRHHPKIITHILKIKQKNKYLSINEVIQLIIMKIKVKNGK